MRLNRLAAIFAASLLFVTAAAATDATHQLTGLGLQQAFWPDDEATVHLDATTSSGRVQLQTSVNHRHLRIHNSSTTVTVFIRFGDSTVAATTTASMPIAPGEIEIVAAPYGYVAGITASGTATVYFTPGEGI